MFGCGFDWKYGKIKVCVDDEFVDVEYMCLEIWVNDFLCKFI